MNVPLEPPFFARTVHPAPPAAITVHEAEIDLDAGDNPFRHLETENPEEFRTHVENGRQVYYENCVFCHGDNLSGNGMFVHGLDPLPTNFADGATIANLRETFLFWRIAKGGPGLPEEGAPWATAMPAWEQSLSEEEIWEVNPLSLRFHGREASRRGGGGRYGMTSCLIGSRALGCLAILIASLCTVAVGSVRAAAQDVGTEAERESGRALYLRNCAQCHGEDGDGAGYATPHLSPRPREFTLGNFKVRSTPSGQLPTHQDLVNIIRRGMPYTSMPAWPDLSDQDVSDLAYYVTTFSPDFSQRGTCPPARAAPERPGSHDRVDRAGESAVRRDRMRGVPRDARSGRWTFS